MIKILSTLALISASVLPIDAAKAAYNWQTYIGERTCVYLRRGVTPYDSGYRAAQDTIASRYGTTFLNATTRLSESQMTNILAVQLMAKCPDALVN